MERDGKLSSSFPSGHFHVFHFLEQVGSEDKFVQSFVAGGEDFLFRAMPFFVPFVDEEDALADAEHGVHVMGVDDGRHVIFRCDAVDEVVDDQRRLRVEAGVRLVAEKVLRVQGDGTRDGYTFLHAAADFAGIFLLRFLEVDAVQAELGTLHAVAIVVRGKHVEREHDVLQHRHGVEEGRALENHAHLPPEGNAFLFRHGQEVASVVEHFSAVRGQQSDDTLHQHRLARAALSDDEVRFAVFKHRADVSQHRAPFKGFMDGFKFNHCDVRSKVGLKTSRRTR